MKNKKKPIAIIFGGKGYEHDVSVSGADFILDNIDTELYEPLPVYITRLGSWRLCKKGSSAHSALLGEASTKATFPVSLDGKNGLLDGIRVKKLYCAFPILHGNGGEDGVVQGALESAGIKYVGAGVAASAVCLDKAHTKAVAEKIGIPTVPYVARNERLPEEPDVAGALAECEHLGYPMFIKPRCLGSSVGCSVVYTPKDFQKAYTKASRLGEGLIIVEKFLSGIREAECGYISYFGKDLFTSAGEIEYNSDFYSFNEKYSKSSSARIITKASLDEEISAKIGDYSKRLVKGLGIRSLARLDFFLTGDAIYFNEVNTMPGMTPASLYPKMIGAMGISPRDMISALIEASLL